MQHYAPEDTIYGDFMMNEYDEPLLKELLQYLTPENLRITLIAQGFKYDKQAQWYASPYSVTPFSSEKLAYYKATSELSFCLPPKNPFICYDLDPQPIDSQSDTPEVIEQLPGFKLWHLQDHEFRVPKGVIYVAIDSPHAVANPRNIVKTRLCVEMFLDSLAKETYQAEIAGMGYNMYAHQGGVTLTLSGFSKKQPELMKMILNRFAKREFSAKRFETIKTH